MAGIKSFILNQPSEFFKETLKAANTVSLKYGDLEKSNIEIGDYVIIPDEKDAIAGCLVKYHAEKYDLVMVWFFFSYISKI